MVNPGGPGGDGLTYAFRYSEFFTLGNSANPNGKLFKEISNQYDMVGFSPRGVGSSSTLTCSSNELLEIENSLIFLTEALKTFAAPSTTHA